MGQKKIAYQSFLWEGNGSFLYLAGEDNWSQVEEISANSQVCYLTVSIA